jgi:hypothetical protein
VVKAAGGPVVFPDAPRATARGTIGAGRAAQATSPPSREYVGPDGGPPDPFARPLRRDRQVGR